LEVTKKIRRFKALDGLRGLAAIMVVIYHFNSEYIPELIYNNTIIRHSNSFVDLFFVLSGFVISYNYRHLSTNNLVFFAKKRFWRLYPLMIFTSTLFLIFNLSSFYPISLNELFTTNHKELLNQIIPYVDSIFLTNSFPVLSSSLGSNTPSWSISAEFVAYFLFALISLFIRPRVIAYLTVSTLGVFLCFLNQKYFATGDAGFLRAIICFNIGAISLMFYDKYKKLKIGFFHELLSIALFLIYIYYILEGSYENKFLAESISTPLVYGVLIFTISLSNGFISEILSSKLMCFLGKISYSIYLNHLIIIFCFRDIFFNHLGFHNSIQNQLFYMVSCLSIILLFSNLTFNFIEKKYNRYA
jgi:peptidoglycan/LPS O-acetylase OafA/YrhL